MQYQKVAFLKINIMLLLLQQTTFRDVFKTQQDI